MLLINPPPPQKKKKKKVLNASLWYLSLSAVVCRRCSSLDEVTMGDMNALVQNEGYIYE